MTVEDKPNTQEIGTRAVGANPYPMIGYNDNGEIAFQQSKDSVPITEEEIATKIEALTAEGGEGVNELTKILEVLHEAQASGTELPLLRVPNKGSVVEDGFDGAKFETPGGEPKISSFDGAKFETPGGEPKVSSIAGGSTPAANAEPVIKPPVVGM